jgi:hypothetical protein
MKKYLQYLNEDIDNTKSILSKPISISKKISTSDILYNLSQTYKDLLFYYEDEDGIRCFYFIYPTKINKHINIDNIEEYSNFIKDVNIPNKGLVLMNSNSFVDFGLWYYSYTERQQESISLSSKHERISSNLNNMSFDEIEIKYLDIVGDKIINEPDYLNTSFVKKLINDYPEIKNRLKIHFPDYFKASDWGLF